MKRTLFTLMLGSSLVNCAWAVDLNAVYQQALQNDPLVNRAKAQRDLAYQGINVSRANLLPNVSGFVSYTDSESDNYNSTTLSTYSTDSQSLRYGLNLSMSLYDHANWIGLDRAEKVAQQADLNYSTAMQDLIVRVTDAYLAILRAKDDVELAQAEKRAVARQLEQTKQRFAVGLTAITDVHEAQANFDTIVAREIATLNTLELRKEQLREISGSYPQSIALLNTELFGTSLPRPNNVDEWLAIAEQQSLDLQLQKFAVDIARADIDGADAGHLPSLALSGSYGKSENTVDDFDLPTLDNQSIGVTLSVPIYSGGRTSAFAEQARYGFVIASENLEQTHRSVTRNVRNAYNNIRATISTIKAFEQAVISAQSALDATQAGFEVGTRTIVDVLNATRSLFSARKNLANARYDYIAANLGLKRAAGTLTATDLATINQGLVE